MSHRFMWIFYSIWKILGNAPKSLLENIIFFQRMLTARSYPGVVRYATYSANPIAKTGTIDDLVHNDALRR